MGEWILEIKQHFHILLGGEMKPKSMDAYIKKYELEYVGMSDREITVYQDDEAEYSSGFKNKYE